MELQVSTRKALSLKSKPKTSVTTRALSFLQAFLAWYDYSGGGNSTTPRYSSTPQNGYHNYLSMINGNGRRGKFKPRSRNQK